jgi:Flp pilus assembly protein TadD
MIFRRTLLISPLLLVACTSTVHTPANRVTITTQTSIFQPAVVAAQVTTEAHDASPTTEAPAARQTYAQSEADPFGRSLYEIWRSSSFQKKFVQSYLAETDIEPRVNADERDEIFEILEQIDKQQFDRAIELLTRKISDPTSSAVFDFTLGNIYFQRDELETASAAYEAAIEKFAKFRRAHKNLGLIHVRQGHFADAVDTLTTVIELGGGDGITYGLLGYAYAQLENSVSAEMAYRMAVLLDPNTLDWKLGLARSYFLQNRHADAAALCDILLEEDPTRTDFWLLQANAYIGLNQPMQAAKNYEIVDQLGAPTADSLKTLGDIYVNEELYELAVDTHIRAMEIDDGENRSPDRAIMAARVLAARSAFDDASVLIDMIEVSYRDVLSVENQKDLLKMQARIAVAREAGDEEVEVLKEIVELDPLDGEALILLGQYSERTGDVEQAIFYYERAASIEAYEADAKVRHAQLLVKQSKYVEALPLLRRAQAIKPRENVQKFIEQVERIASSR